MVWRRKWLILLPTAAIAVAVAAVVWKLPNVYESTTLLSVRPASIATEAVGQLSDGDLTLRINNITQDVTSRTSLTNLIEKYNLYPRERARGAAMDELVERMRTRDLDIKLNTTRNDITNGFYLSFRGQDPRPTQAVAAELAGKYVDSQKRASSEDALLTKDFFDQRVQQEKEKLDEIDRRRLQAMMRNIRNLPSSTQALVGQLAGLRDEQQTRIAEVGRLNDQITSLNRLVNDLAKVNQQQVEEVIAQMQDPKSTAAYAELVKRRAQLESDKGALKTQFRDKHPDVIAVQSQIDSVQGQMDGMVEEHKRRVEETRERLSGKVDPRLNAYKSDIARLQGEIKRQQALLDGVEGQIVSVGGSINNVPAAEVELEAINREYLTEEGRLRSARSGSRRRPTRWRRWPGARRANRLRSSTRRACRSSRSRRSARC